MAGNATRVGAPINAAGGFYSDSLTAELPTDADSPLPSTAVALGILGEDGLSETEDRNTDQKRGWGGQIARTLQTEYGLQVTLTFLERSTAVLKEVYGEDNVVETTEQQRRLRSVARKADQLPRKRYYAEMKDGDAKIRIVYPDAQIVEVGDVNYVHSDVVAYEVTLECYLDENGSPSYQYDSEPVSATSSVG